MSVKKNPLEWTVFALSVLLIGATIAILARGIVRDRSMPVDLIITVGEASRASAGYRVPVTVRNAGDRTAEQVFAEVILEAEGRERARGELTITFVPGHSTREAWVMFSEDPSCCTMTPRILGFEQP